MLCGVKVLEMSLIGVWYYPNGSQVSTVDDSSPLHSVYMTGTYWTIS